MSAFEMQCESTWIQKGVTMQDFYYRHLVKFRNSCKNVAGAS